MSITLYASLDQFKGTVGEDYLDGAYHKIAKQAKDNGSTTALQLGAAKIKRALTRGGYSLSTIEANPTTWVELTQLNCDLAACKLTLGAAGSSLADAKKSTMGSVCEQADELLKELTGGKIGLVSTADVDDITAPHAARGIVVSDRSTGVDLIPAEDWEADDPIDQDTYGTVGYD